MALWAWETSYGPGKAAHAWASEHAVKPVCNHAAKRAGHLRPVYDGKPPPYACGYCLRSLGINDDGTPAGDLHVKQR